MINLKDELNAIDGISDQLVLVVLDRIQPEQREMFDDWREWFTAARQHPHDPYPARRAEETLIELLK